MYTYYGALLLAFHVFDLSVQSNGSKIYSCNVDNYLLVLSISYFLYFYIYLIFGI
jgi:hypothetical protein